MISQRTVNKLIPETLTLSGELAIAFLEIVHVQLSILYLSQVLRHGSSLGLCEGAGTPHYHGSSSIFAHHNVPAQQCYSTFDLCVYWN